MINYNKYTFPLLNCAVEYCQSEVNTASKVSKLNAGQVCFPASYVKLCPAAAEHVSATQASLLHTAHTSL